MAGSQVSARARGRPGRRAPLAAIALTLGAACASWAVVQWATGFALPSGGMATSRGEVGRSKVSRTGLAADKDDLDAAGFGRRGVALSLGTAALAPALPAAAEGAGAAAPPGKPSTQLGGNGPLDPASPTGAPKPDMWFQRAVLNVATEDELKKELRFWTEAVKMKQIGEYKDAKGLKSVVMGFSPETGDSSGVFALEFKVDPEVLKYPSLPELNFKVMQPLVNAFNFVQVSVDSTPREQLKRTMTYGGNAIFGGTDYIDVESPRLVPLRFVQREGPPKIDLVSFNVEANTFEATKKFYQRAFGFAPMRYDETIEPPIQPKSQLLGSLGGPKLLLCPVPNERLKDVNYDYFFNMVALTSDVAKLETSVDAAMTVAEEEEKEIDKRLELKITTLKNPDEIERYQKVLEARRKGNRYTPTKTNSKDKSVTSVDDGNGNMVLVSTPAIFKTSLAAATV